MARRNVLPTKLGRLSWPRGGRGRIIGRSGGGGSSCSAASSLARGGLLGDHSPRGLGDQLILVCEIEPLRKEKAKKNKKKENSRTRTTKETNEDKKRKEEKQATKKKKKSHLAQ